MFFPVHTDFLSSGSTFVIFFPLYVFACFFLFILTSHFCESFSVFIVGPFIISLLLSASTCFVEPYLFSLCCFYTWFALLTLRPASLPCFGLTRAWGGVAFTLLTCVHDWGKVLAFRILKHSVLLSKKTWKGTQSQAAPDLNELASRVTLSRILTSRTHG